MAAMRAAEYWDVPLVTFFHDWYPASSGVHPLLQFLADSEFRTLYRKSALALCVSTEMMQALGPHPNAIVLPPIPSGGEISPGPASIRPVPNILYAGFCGGAYFYMLKQCMEACSNTEARMTIVGMDAGALGSSTSKVSVLGFLDDPAFKGVFEEVDILMVLLNFDERNKKHFSTHFPSKLVEYCGKGKLIGILGPSYSTSVRWAESTGAAFAYTQNDPALFISKLLEVYQNAELRTTFISNALRVFREEFSPEFVHQTLVSKIAILLEKE
jgi:hypothetical protein